MSTKRRDFLKMTGFTGVGFLSSAFLGKAANTGQLAPEWEETGFGRFNMCCFAAPKLEKVRIGFIGLIDAGRRKYPDYLNPLF